MHRYALLLALIMTVVTGCRSKPDCFECGLNEEWDRAEQAQTESEAESPTAEPEPVAEQPASPPVGKPLMDDDAPGTKRTKSMTRPREEWLPMPARPEDKNCSEHTAAIKACASRGPNWAYELVTPTWDKGTRPPDDWSERAEQWASCECYDKVRAQEKRHRPPPRTKRPSSGGSGAEEILPE